MCHGSTNINNNECTHGDDSTNAVSLSKRYTLRVIQSVGVLSICRTKFDNATKIKSRSEPMMINMVGTYLSFYWYDGKIYIENSLR